MKEFGKALGCVLEVTTSLNHMLQKRQYCKVITKSIDLFCYKRKYRVEYSRNRALNQIWKTKDLKTEILR